MVSPESPHVFQAYFWGSVGGVAGRVLRWRKVTGGVDGIENIAVLAEAVLQVVIVQPDKVMINYRLPRVRLAET